MCPVHVNEGPGGDGSRCVWQLPQTTAPQFLLVLKYPGVTSAPTSVRGEEILFLMAISRLWRSLRAFLACSGVDDLEEGSPILPHNCSMCSHPCVTLSHGEFPGSSRPPWHHLQLLGSRHQGSACLNHYYTS